MPTNNENQVLIYDTSAFIGGMDPQAIHIPQWTTPENLEEIRNKNTREILQMAIKTGRIKLRSPSEPFIKKVIEETKKTGDYSKLSEIDIKVLALALEFQSENWHPIIMTDDYSIQNVASSLKIDYKSVSESGIRTQLRWKVYCPGCGADYPIDTKFKKCDICGTKLKRKSY
ncbi:MAG: NOB1 family endonuclease [Candidatus Helarchaeota archaeon]